VLTSDVSAFSKEQSSKIKLTLIQVTENTMNSLIKKQCRHYSKDESPLNLSQIEDNRSQTPEWQFCATENKLSQTFHFDNYNQTISFVNKVADVSNSQNHHPEMEVSYNRCKVMFYTHSVDGITENDFICAALIDEHLR